MITVGELRKIIDDCWIDILTLNDNGNPVVIFSEIKERCNIPSFIENLPVYHIDIDNYDTKTINIYLKNEYYEKE